MRLLILTATLLFTTLVAANPLDTLEARQLKKSKPKSGGGGAEEETTSSFIASSTSSATSSATQLAATTSSQRSGAYATQAPALMAGIVGVVGGALYYV